ncbi:MAG TPA: hypothetical protein VGX03_09560 [Candidatus Binatia bacterium]|jgi:hypothetical protein|nr:hypothetical protein [Candidatus Binatia bacterium]
MDATSEPLDRQQNPQVSHERSDVSVFVILVFGIGLLVSALVISLLIWWLFNSFAARAARSDRPLPTLAPRATGEPVPPEPRLQVSPSQDLREMRAAEDAILNSYGWADQPTGVVRVPVEQAMQVLAQRGLPVDPGGEKTEKRGNGETGNEEKR